MRNLIRSLREFPQMVIEFWHLIWDRDDRPRGS